jgi:hypothetical protein
MRSHSGRLSFWIKPLTAVALVVLADTSFYGGHVGSTLGIFAFALVVAVVATSRAVRRDRRALSALVLATLSALMLFDAPSFVGWLLYWGTLAVAVLSPRVGSGLDAAPWFKRLGHLACVGMFGTFLDALRLRKRLNLPSGAVPRLLAIVTVPVIGGALFLSLFASANPVISQTLRGFSFPDFDIVRLLFWLFCLVGVWSFLRPQFPHARPRTQAMPADRPIPGINVASVGLSLGVFNVLFALQGPG